MPQLSTHKLHACLGAQALLLHEGHRLLFLCPLNPPFGVFQETPSYARQRMLISSCRLQ